MWHFPCFPICFPFRSHFPMSPSPFSSHFLTWGHLGRPFEGHLNALGCEAWQASGEMPLSNGPFFGGFGMRSSLDQPPQDVDNIFWYGSWKWWVNPRSVFDYLENFSVSRLSNNWSSFKVFRRSSKSSFGQHESWASMTFQSHSLLFPSWSDSGRDTNSTISIFRLEALAYIDHGSSLNHLSGMPLCLMPQADPWRSLDRAGDKKRSVAHEMEHHICLLVGHIVGIGQPGNEITTSGQDVLKKCRLPKKTGSYKCF